MWKKVFRCACNIIVIFFLSIFFPCTLGIESNEKYYSSPANNWPMFRHDAAHTGYSLSAAPNTNSTLWNFSISQPFYSSPSVADETLYIGGDDGQFYALEMLTGNVRWNFTVDGIIHSSPACANGIVYFGTNQNDNTGKLYALRDNGTELWHKSFSGPVDAAPTVDENHIYVSVGDNYTYCYDFSGNEIWRNETAAWLSSPAVDATHVYVGGWDGTLYALNKISGTIDWSYRVSTHPLYEFPVESSPTVINGIVYFGAYDGKIYAVKKGIVPGTGEKVWEYPTGSNLIHSSPAVAGRYVLIGANTTLYALDKNNGDELWSYPTNDVIRSSPAVADGKVFFGSDDGYLYALNLTTGRLVWKYRTGAPVSSSPAIADGKLYVGSVNRKLYCFGTGYVPSLSAKLSVPSEIGSARWGTISVEVRNDTGSVVSGAKVVLSADNPGLRINSSTGTTDSKGFFSTGFRAPTVTVPTTVRIMVNVSKTGYRLGTNRTQISVQLVFSASMVSEKNVLLSNETVKIYIHAFTDSRPFWGAIVTMETEPAHQGIFNPSTGDTDLYGNFSTTFCAPVVMSPTQIAIVATLKKPNYIDEKARLILTINPVSMLRINISADATRLSALHETIIRVHVSNNTSAVEGASVTLSSDRGGRFVSQTGTTDGSGNFTARFTAPDVELQIVCRISALVSKTGYPDTENFVLVTVDPNPQLMIEFTATPPIVNSRGKVAISVRVINESSGSPVSHANVRIQTTAGELTKSEGLTDLSGNFLTTLTAPQLPRTIPQLNITLNATASATWYRNGTGTITVRVLYFNARPMCTLTTPRNNETVRDIVSVEGTATDPDGDSEIVRIEVSIDSGNWEEAVGTTAWSYVWDTTTVADGVHKIHVRAYDGANYSEIVTVSVNVRNVAGDEEKKFPGFEMLYFTAAMALVLLTHKIASQFCAMGRKPSLLRLRVFGKR